MHKQSAGARESKCGINPEIVMGSVAPEIWTSVNGHTKETEESGNGERINDQ